MKRENEGFTLLELLVVVAIIGIIATIAIPAMKLAIARAKQKRTMVEMKSVAKAVEAYRIDFSAVPIASGGVTAITANVTPTYLKVLPATDAWGGTVFYEGSGANYTLVSAGGDYVLQAGPPTGPTTSVNSDIIFSDGNFVQWPEGVQIE